MDTQTHIQHILKNVFGFDNLRHGQTEIIHHIINGQNVLAVMPTGSGKSLCWQIPALMSDKKTIVVSPLIALIDDQTTALQHNGVAVECIHSGKSRDENVMAWKNFVSPTGKILYMSPERLMTDRMLNILQRHNIGMIVVDEAHCISKWGPSFRPDYESLSHLKSLFPQTTICGFTATADKATRDDIAEKLFSGKGKIIVKGFNRPNLSLSVYLKKNFKRTLLDYIKNRPHQSGIVYCLSRKNTEDISDYLNANGITALPYHAGKSASERTTLQNQFMTDSGVVMVATIAFGMGIDKPDIRFVVHANLPSSMEAFYQEIGRAGRDSNPADTILFYDLQDIIQRQRMIFEQHTAQDHKIAENTRLQSLIGYVESAQCRRKLLLEYFDDTATSCGNCDNCLSPPKVQDCSEYAQHVIRAVQQTGEYFGANYIIDIIRGAKNQNIRDFHMNLPCFGVGKHNSKPLYQTVIRQLIVNGYLQVDFNKFGAIRLHPSSENILNDTEKFKSILPTAKPSPKTQKNSDTPNISLEDNNLLLKLKALRLQIAKDKKVPAFVVFSDKTLKDMCIKKPLTKQDFLTVHGIGQQKCDLYFKQFTDVIKEYDSK